MAPELREVHGTLLKAAKIGWQHKGRSDVPMGSEEGAVDMKQR
jgi:hypothetical protein